MKKILLLNVGCSNMGNVALVNTTIDNINNFIPNVKFSLMGIKEDNAQIIEQIGLNYGISFKKPYNSLISMIYLLECLFVRLFNKLGIKISFPKSSRLYEYYECDLVINSGGDHLSGESGYGALSTYLDILYAIILYKPVVLYGESLGYYNSYIMNIVAKFILNRTKLIIVREKYSLNYLKDNNIKNPNIHLSADPAFLLNPISKQDTLNIFTKENIQLKEQIIGINPSGLISKYSKNISDKQFVKILSETIDSLIINLNVDILLIPHVYGSKDDRIIINQIFKEITNKKRVQTIKNEYAPEELKGVIRECELFVGARMHTAIASTSMYIPTVGIAYGHKMHGIIGEMLNLEDYIIDINELTADNLIFTINKAWKNKKEIKLHLRHQIPKIKKNTLLNGKLVKDLLESSMD